MKNKCESRTENKQTKKTCLRDQCLLNSDWKELEELRKTALR